MRIVVGLHTAGLRLSLEVCSEDVESHSIMSENADIFKEVTDSLATYGRGLLQERTLVLKERKPL